MSKFTINETILKSALLELASETFQRDIWLNQNNPQGLVCSFSEAAIQFYDDSVVGEALERGKIIYDKNITVKMLELNQLLDLVGEFTQREDYRPEEEIINDPNMELVRKKAAEILDLISKSDRKESTVGFLNVPQSD